jgi:toxin ParE1/3/4
MQIRWALKARADLFDIDHHYREIDPDLADAMLDRIEDAPTILIDHPQAGETIDSLGVRKWRVRRTSFLLLYRFTRGRIEITRVVHASGDWRRAR